MTMASSTTKPTESTIASSVSRLIVKPASQHEKHGADQRDRNRDHRNQHGAERSQEQEDDHHDDEQRLDQRVEHFVDRVLNVFRRIVGNAKLHARGQLAWIAGNACAHLSNDFQRIRSGKNPDAHEGRGLAVEADVLVVVLGAQHDVGDFAEANDDAVLLLHDHLLKFSGVRRSVLAIRFTDTMEPLVLPKRGKIVVLGKRIMHVGGRNATRGHLLRLEPDAHGECAIAEDVGALHATDRAQLGLHDAGQVIGDLVLIEIGRKKIPDTSRQIACRQSADQ